VEHFDSLIVSRIYEITACVNQTFDYIDEVEFYNQIDIDQVISQRRFICRAALRGGYSLSILERYSYQNYQLSIVHYSYVLVNPLGEFVLRCDNSSHYPHLANFPHHKHLYPKDRYSPTSFSGKLSDALAEARWIIEKLS
jgi:hypothetical protein